MRSRANAHYGKSHIDSIISYNNRISKKSIPGMDTSRALMAKKAERMRNFVASRT